MAFIDSSSLASLLTTFFQNNPAFHKYGDEEDVALMGNTLQFYTLLDLIDSIRQAIENQEEVESAEEKTLKTVPVRELEKSQPENSRAGKRARENRLSSFRICRMNSTPSSNRTRFGKSSSFSRSSIRKNTAFCWMNCWPCKKASAVFVSRSTKRRPKSAAF